MNQSERRQFLIQSLLRERPEYRKMGIPADEDEQHQLLRGLMNVRAPRRIGADFLQVQDDYLQDETAAKGITDLADLTPVQPGLYFWQGDITTLKCDAIVNAANSGMTGCYVPNHRCIDNAIHTFAGVELRLACAELMERQGYPEPTGIHIPKAVLLCEIGKVLFKPFAGVDESGGGGKPCARADNHGVAIPQSGSEPLNLLGAAFRRCVCPNP